VIGPNVSVWGSTVYVVDPQVDVTGGKDKFFASIDGGDTFTARPVPCAANPDVALFQAAPSSATNVALLCDGEPGGFRARKDVYRSTDTGKHDTFAGELAPFGYQAQLAVSPSGNLAVADYSDGSFMDTNTTKTGTVWKRPIASGDGGAGWNDLTWTGNTTAWVVGAPVELPADIGKILVTHDSWRTWHFANL